MAKTLPLPCVFTAFVAKTLPLLVCICVRSSGQTPAYFASRLSGLASKACLKVILQVHTASRGTQPLRVGTAPHKTGCLLPRSPIGWVCRLSTHVDIRLRRERLCCPGRAVCRPAGKGSEGRCSRCRQAVSVGHDGHTHPTCECSRSGPAPVLTNALWSLTIHFASLLLARALSLSQRSALSHAGRAQASELQLGHLPAERPQGQGAPEVSLGFSMSEKAVIYLLVFKQNNHLECMYPH